MATSSDEILQALAAVGASGVYAPVVDLVRGGRLDLGRLMTTLAAPATPLSHRSRLTLRTYLPPIPPTGPSLLLDGCVLGAELPLALDAWCVVEAGAVAVHVPRGLPATITTASVGRPLGAVVELEGLEPMTYPIAEVGEIADVHGAWFDVIRAPAPVVPIDALALSRSA